MQSARSRAISSASIRRSGTRSRRRAVRGSCSRSHHGPASATTASTSALALLDCRRRARLARQPAAVGEAVDRVRERDEEARVQHAERKRVQIAAISLRPAEREEDEHDDPEECGTAESAPPGRRLRLAGRPSPALLLLLRGRGRGALLLWTLRL